MMYFYTVILTYGYTFFENLESRILLSAVMLLSFPPILFLYSLPPLSPLLIPCWSLQSRRCAAPAEAAFWPVSTPTTTWWETTPCRGTAPALSGRKAPSLRPSPSTSANRNTRRSSLGNIWTRFEHLLHEQFLLWVSYIEVSSVLIKTNMLEPFTYSHF